MKASASKLELLERCPAAGALSAAWFESTPDQIAGTGRHRFMQRAAELGRDAALVEIPADAPWRAQCEALVLDDVPAGDYELAYAYDTATDTARFLGPWLDRAYDVSATEVSGTADLVCPPTAERPRWLVVDFKGDDDVAPATVNLQVGFYALAVARLYGVDEIDVAIGYLRHGGGIRWDRATLGDFDIEAVASRVRDVASRIATARAALTAGAGLDYAVGMHCRWCSSLTFCPANTATARAWIAGDAPSTDALAKLSDEDAGRAWALSKALEEQVERVRAVLRERALVRGLPLPDGERLVPVETATRTLVFARAEAALRARFGDQVDAFIERSLTNEAVTKLAKQLAAGKGQKKALDGLWSELEGAGAVKRGAFVQLRVKKPKGGAAPVDAQDGES